MPKAVVVYVRFVDGINHFVGRCIMYLILVMMGLLLYAALSRTVFNNPLLWGVQMSQFLMAAYYLLGGGYSMQQGAHVRMDLIYSRFSERGKAIADSLTSVFLILYLVALFVGGVMSTEYSLTYDQRFHSAWAPRVAPIKIIMTIGIGLMLLQATSMFLKDVARALGREIE